MSVKLHVSDSADTHKVATNSTSLLVTVSMLAGHVYKLRVNKSQIQLRPSKTGLIQTQLDDILHTDNIQLLPLQLLLFFGHSLTYI